MKMTKKIFVSNRSFDDAAFDAKMAGYTVVGKAKNKKGQFVVFGRAQQVFI